MTSISAQQGIHVGTPAPGIAPPETPQNGRGDSTRAIQQASSSPFISIPGAEGASDDGGVPAKKSVSVHRDFAGTKTMEFVDPISLAKLVSIADDQLPPLISMIIDGLPPIQQSKYVHEGEKRLHKYVEHYPSVSSLSSYCRLGLSVASYLHSGVINVDRLVAISIHYALLVMVDDIFFDAPDEFCLDQYGINRSTCESPEKVQEYIDHLNAVFSQQVQPSNPTPLIETMMWELGRDMLELSNREWFGNFAASVVKHHSAGVTSHRDIVQGNNLCFQNLEAYTLMRARNAGGEFVQLMVEFANDSYIPGILRKTPYMENIIMATSIHIGFVNDVFSYHKESQLEQNPRNLITMLMECEGKPFVETVHMAIDLTNTYARAIMDLEAEAWDSTLQKHLQDIKALMAGNFYFSFMDKRYRHPDSFFPELRDTTSSWKIVPDLEGLEL